MHKLVAILFCFIALTSAANKIDKLDHIYDIERFIIRHDRSLKDMLFGAYYQKGQKKTADSLGVKDWYKADFDGNGLTDVAILGSYDLFNTNIVICLDKGHKYEVVKLPEKYTRTQLYPIQKKYDNKEIILLYYNTAWFDTTGQIKGVDTIAYYNGGLIEYTATPTNHTIEKINFSTSACFGTCPQFDMELTLGLVTIKEYKLFSDTLFGIYNKKTEPYAFNDIALLLNYIGFERLKEQYDAPITDMQGCTLTITYNNGKTKTINDYPMQGTYGLVVVYNKLFKIRKGFSYVKKLQRKRNRRFIKGE